MYSIVIRDQKAVIIAWDVFLKEGRENTNLEWTAMLHKKASIFENEL